MRMFIIDESAEDVVTRSIKDRLSLGKRPARVTRGIMKRKETVSSFLAMCNLL